SVRAAIDCGEVPVAYDLRCLAMSSVARKVLAFGLCAALIGVAALLQRGGPSSAQDAVRPPPIPPETKSLTDQPNGAARTSLAVPPWFVVAPYLQFPTRDSITIMWETAQPGTSVVEYGTISSNMAKVEQDKKATIHEVPLKGLKPNTQYVYRVSSTD